ncbi:MAG: InlB B-repeat-containing protein [Rhodanobacteraceae bacterium]|nr:InlB B-repeat-containing protein [Rhodanobacteraceae bacterium]
MSPSSTSQERWSGVQPTNGTGNNTDVAYALAVDASGNVLVTGYSYNSSGNYDYATVKYASDGTQLWVQTYNGTGNNNDYAYALAVDASGNVLVTGNAYNGSSNDYATVKYASDGTPLWVQTYNGTGNNHDYANALAVDASGNVLVTGRSNNGGNDDYATVKYASDGTPLWVQTYNGTGNNTDQANALAVDASGNVLVTGYSIGSSGNADYATVKYASDGTPLWVQTYNGTGNNYDYANALAVDASGNVLVTGYSYSSSGNADYATVKYASDGTPLWVQTYNGTGNNTDVAYALAVDAGGNVLVTGRSYSSSGNDDYATVKYASDGTQLWVHNYDGGRGLQDTARAVAVDANGRVTIAGSVHENSGYGRIGVVRIAAAYTVTASAGANGSMTPASQTVLQADDAQFTVTPATGYHVDTITGTTCSPVDLGGGLWKAANITQDCAVTATFAINQYTLTYTVGANGSISGVSPQTVSSGGNGSTVTAVADAGYQFAQWSDASTNNPRTDTNVTSNITVSAQFVVNQYTVSFDSQGGSAVAAITQDFASTVTVPAAPTRSGYTFSSWNTAADGSGTSYAPAATFAMPANDSTLYAIWTINQYTLTYSAGANGSITGTSPQTVNHGSDGSSVTAVAAAGYHFVNWSDNATSNPRTDMNVTGDITVTANFANDAPSISVVADQTILEDSGTTVVTVTLSDLETALVDLQLTAQSSNTALIADPTIGTNANPAERTLSFAPASNGNGGPVTITLTATHSAPATSQRTFAITVTPANDAPSLTLATSPTHPAATIGVQSVPNFASVDLGPTDEDATQAVADFLIDSVVDADGVLVASSLDIANNGTLSYTLSGIGGGATITTRIRDDGGMLNGGIDTSGTQQFTLHVAPGADLQIAKTNNRVSLLDGEVTVYAVVVANAGPNAVTGARLVDTLPSTLINGSWACVQASSTATCPVPDANNGNLDVFISLGVNQYLRFDVMAEVDGVIEAQVINTATATVPAGITALNTGDDSATDTDLIVPVGVFINGFEDITRKTLTVPGAQEALAD